MKTTAGYLIALFLGLLVGWVAQQFWLNTTAEHTLLPSQNSISRQQQRLIDLRQQASSIEQASQSELPHSAHLNAFMHALNDHQLDLALELFYELDQPTLAQLLKLAELAYETRDYKLLFSTLYEFRYGLDFDEENLLLSKITEWVEKVDETLGDKQQYDELVSIYRQLTSLEAENTLYYLRLSYWQLQAGQPFAASQSLLGARNDIELKTEVAQLQVAINLYEEYGAHIDIPLSAEGEHYLVPVTIGNTETLQLMLDTGASKTVVKQSVLNSNRSIVTEKLSELLMNTANGQVVGYSVNVSDVKIGTLNLNSLDVVLMELPNFKYDGLLGMNVLSQFDFNIDQENAILRLLPKKPKLGISP